MSISASVTTARIINTFNQRKTIGRHWFPLFSLPSIMRTIKPEMGSKQYIIIGRLKCKPQNKSGKCYSKIPIIYARTIFVNGITNR